MYVNLPSINNPWQSQTFYVPNSRQIHSTGELHTIWSYKKDCPLQHKNKVLLEIQLELNNA